MGRAFGVVSSLTLLSRIFGLVRDMATARVFGDTAVGSAFAAGFAVPNLFRRLFGEGALSAAAIPRYAAILKSDRGLSDRYATLMMAGLTIVSVAVTIVVEGALLAWVLLSPGDADKRLSIHLVMLFLPFMPLVCVGAVLGGVLQVHGRFAPMAAQPIVLNACILAAIGFGLGVLGLSEEATAVAIAVAVSASGLIQVGWSVFALRRHVRWTRVFGGVRGEVRATMRAFVPAVIGLGTIQLNAFVDTLIAMWPIWVGPTMLGLICPLDDASNSVLFYAQRLYQFPLGVFGIAIASVVFPMLARESGDPGAFSRVLWRGVRLSLFISVPASVGLLLVAEDLVAVLYGRGGSGFSEEGARRATEVLLGYAPGVWAYALNHVLTRAFYARGDTGTPMRVSIAMVGINLAMNLTLIWWMREAGLAVATTVSAAIQCAVLWWLLKRNGSLAAHEPARLLPMLASAVVMGGCVYGVVLLMPGVDWTGRLIRLVAASCVGVCVFGVLSVLLRRDELRWLLSKK